MTEGRLAGNLDLSSLSPRESDVLEVAIQGLSAREIADRLSLTEATVRSHLSAAYSKLGVSGRVELLARMNADAGRERTAPAAADLGDGDPESADRAHRADRLRVGHRSMAMWAYSLWFGAVFAEGFYGHTTMIDGKPDTGLLYVWTAMALAGSILVVIKNLRIADRRLRSRFWLSDLAVISTALLLLAVLPASIGMVRGIVLLLIFGPYMYWYLKTLIAANLWQPRPGAR